MRLAPASPVSYLAVVSSLLSPYCSVMRSIAFILFLVASVFLCARGQNSEQLNFRHFRVEDGLSQGSINAILQDHKGFIWVGTHDGLNRFDGMEFKVFRSEPGNPHSLSSSWIIALIEDSTHVLWVRTERGLDRFDRSSESFVRVTPSTTPIVPFAMEESPTFLVTGKPIAVFDPASGHIVELDIRSKNNITFDEGTHLLAQDYDGYVWAVGPSTLYKIDPRKKILEQFFDIGAKNVNTILPSRYYRGDIWLGTYSELLHLRNGKLSSIGKYRVTSLAEDSQGYLWIGTEEGLARINLRDSMAFYVEQFYHDPVVTTSLSHNVVTHLFEDASGSLWVGTYNGLNVFDRFSTAFSIYRSSPDNPNGLGDNFVMPIVEDGAGNIWFGTFSEGVSVLQKAGPQAGTFIHFRHDSLNPNSLRSNNVRSILCGKDGRLWIGSARGLNIYDPVTRRMTTVLSRSADDSRSFWIESMCESRDGSIWIPLNGQMIRLDRNNLAGSVIQRFPFPVFGEFVSTREDSKGIIWLATVGTGLIRFDPRSGNIVRYVYDPKNTTSLSNNNVWSTFQDPNDTSGTVWVGTSNGLNRLNRNTGICKRYPAQEGFPNSWVYGILQDEAQRLWLSTNHGIVLFDDRLPEGRKFKNYTYADGIAGDEFNRRAYCRLRNGELLFGGPNGVTRFHPGKVHDNPAVPPLVLTGFRKLGKSVIFDRDVADVTSVELNHDESVFSFEFAALNFSNASKNQFAYMMEGIDKDWVHSGTRHSVNYAYLSPGTYVFRVKASHNSGVWNKNEIAVLVHIHPPYWATWWFITLCVCAVAGLIATVVRARVRRLLEMERLRSRIARDLHDEIGSNLSSIAMASDLLGRQSEFGTKERGKLSEISSVALSTVKDMKDIVWLLNPGNDSLDDLFLRMKDTATTLLEGCHYTLRFPEQSNGKRVNLEWKRNLYLIYKETLTNIIRHARATSVAIDVRVEADRLVLQINDDGMGFDPNTVRSGNGLKNIHERAGLMRARLNIEAHPGSGTTVRLETRIT